MDHGILRTFKHLTSHLEVRACSEHQLQDAIRAGLLRAEAASKLPKKASSSIDAENRICSAARVRLTFTDRLQVTG